MKERLGYKEKKEAREKSRSFGDLQEIWKRTRKERGEGGYEEEEEGFRVSKASGYREGIRERIG